MMKSFIILFSVLLFIVNCQDIKVCPQLNKESKNQQVKCTTQVQPVCGIIENKRGMQIHKDFSNSCVACSQGKVQFTVSGNCSNYPQKAKFCLPSSNSQSIVLMNKQLSQSPNQQKEVCGYFNQNVKCLVAPCAISATSKVIACKNKNVLYTLDEPCPKIGK